MDNLKVIMTREQINSQQILILEARLIIGRVQEQELDAVRDQFAEFERDYYERTDDVGTLLYAKLEQFRSAVIDYLHDQRISWDDYKRLDAIDHDLFIYRKRLGRK